MLKKYLLCFIFILLSTSISLPTRINKQLDLNKQINQEQFFLEKELKHSFILGYGSSPYNNREKMEFLNTPPVFLEPKDNGFLEAFQANPSLSIKQLYPYSIVKLEFDLEELATHLGYPGNYFDTHSMMKPLIKPATIHFLDGSTADATEHLIQDKALKKTLRELKQKPQELSKTEEKHYKALLETTQSKYAFVILHPKPIQSITYTIELPLAKHQVHSLKPNEWLKTDQGNIYVEAFTNNVVVYHAPKTLLSQLGVVASYKNKQFLKERYREDVYWLPDSVRNNYETRLSTLKQAQTLLNSEKNIDEQALKDWLNNKHSPFLLSILPEQRWINQGFNGLVKQAYFIIHDTKPIDKKIFTLTYKQKKDKNDKDNDSNQDQLIRHDFKTGLLGLLKTNGKWLVKPQYTQLNVAKSTSSKVIPYHFMARKPESTATSLYHLDQKTAKLNKVSYKTLLEPLVNNQYQTIEEKDEQGIIHLKSGKIIVPPKYSYVNVSDDGLFFFGITKNAKKQFDYDVFDQDGKLLFSSPHSVVYYDKEYFYADVEDGIPEIYTLAGENITKGRFSTLYPPFIEGLMKVKKLKYYGKKDTFFINKKGDTVLDLNANGWISSGEFFTDGTIYVKDKETHLYGFIDAKANIILPFIYADVIFGFMPESHLALVLKKKDSTHFDLIDKKGKTQAKLPLSLIEIDYEDDLTKIRFKFKDGQVYDSFGQRIDKE